MKSVTTGCEDQMGSDPEDFEEIGYYTGGPFYGPFGVTGLSNDWVTKMHPIVPSLVNQHFVDAVEAADGDKFDVRTPVRRLTARHCVCPVTSVHR